MCSGVDGSPPFGIETVVNLLNAPVVTLAAGVVLFQTSTSSLVRLRGPCVGPAFVEVCPKGLWWNGEKHPVGIRHFCTQCFKPSTQNLFCKKRNTTYRTYVVRSEMRGLEPLTSYESTGGAQQPVIKWRPLNPRAASHQLPA